jgi:hypothetical protein
MNAGPSPNPPAAPRRPWWLGLLQRALRVVAMGLVLTVFYAWARPHFQPREGPSGFAYGMLHGAIMPMALPALLAGQDVTIYAESNTGRLYKLGYTIGINVCGLLVFGTTFWTPRPKDARDGGWARSRRAASE